MFCLGDKHAFSATEPQSPHVLKSARLLLPCHSWLTLLSARKNPNAFQLPSGLFRTFEMRLLSQLDYPGILSLWSRIYRKIKKQRILTKSNPLLPSHLPYTTSHFRGRPGKSCPGKGILQGRGNFGSNRRVSQLLSGIFSGPS